MLRTSDAIAYFEPIIQNDLCRPFIADAVHQFRPLTTQLFLTLIPNFCLEEVLSLTP